MKIFWLDDLHYRNTELLDTLVQLNQIENVTFAFDYKNGQQIIENTDGFDIYILDADFPFEISNQRKTELTNKLNKYKEQSSCLNSAEIKILATSTGIDSCFLPFYINELIPYHGKHIKKNNAQVLIYSSSDSEAFYLAQQLNLPYYSKNPIELQTKSDKLNSLKTTNDLIREWFVLR